MAEMGDVRRLDISESTIRGGKETKERWVDQYGVRRKGKRVIRTTSTRNFDPFDLRSNAEGLS